MKCKCGFWTVNAYNMREHLRTSCPFRNSYRTSTESINFPAQMIINEVAQFPSDTDISATIDIPSTDTFEGGGGEFGGGGASGEW